jgi:hypothetical protein
VALLSISACGAGLNLTRAKVALFGELSWSLGQILQAEARIHRLGQIAKEVRIIYITAIGTADDNVWNQLQSKHQVVGATVGAIEDNSHGTGMRITATASQETASKLQQQKMTGFLDAGAQQAALAGAVAYTNRSADATAPAHAPRSGLVYDLFQCDGGQGSSSSSSSSNAYDAHGASSSAQEGKFPDAGSGGVSSYYSVGAVAHACASAAPMGAGMGVDVSAGADTGAGGLQMTSGCAFPSANTYGAEGEGSAGGAYGAARTTAVGALGAVGEVPGISHSAPAFSLMPLSSYPEEFAYSAGDSQTTSAESALPAPVFTAAPVSTYAYNSASVPTTASASTSAGTATAMSLGKPPTIPSKAAAPSARVEYPPAVSAAPRCGAGAGPGMSIVLGMVVGVGAGVGAGLGLGLGSGLG